MPSPFPGMDPYLEEEAHWPTFQQQLLATLSQMLLPNLGDRYRLRVATRSYFTEQVLFTSIQRDEHHEDYLEIRLRSDGRMATLVQMVAPHNRLTPQGRKEYLAIREANRLAGANTIDIELLLHGTPILDRGSGPAVDYAVGLSRAGGPDKIELAATALDKPLPRFKLPLGRNDRDLVVDLGAVLTRTYDQAGFAKRIDYSQDPKVKMCPEYLKWVDTVLKTGKLRGT